MKKLLLTLSLILSALTLSANPVDYQTARTIAENFATAQRVPTPDVISLVPEQTFTQLYVFGFRGQAGFVIISADDRAIPILGYSLTAEFPSTNLPDHISAWLRDYEKQINWLIDKRIEPSAETQNRWSQLLNISNSNTLLIDTVVQPLITTHWAQDTYYNNLCPMIGSERTVTGCSATAMAQVMKYWGHPSSGHGSRSYLWNGQTLSADFGNTTYDWENMPSDSLGAASTSTQIDAVATLMYHVGVSMNMNYGLASDNGSSSLRIYSMVLNSPCCESALKNNFMYVNTLRGILYCKMTDVQWKNTLKNELDNSRPVLYEGSDSAGGNSFICDGYDSQDFFHFNWGWGGYCDGFYAIGALNPQSSGTGGCSTYNYNISNSAVIGIEPIRGRIPSQTSVLATSGNPEWGYTGSENPYYQYDTIKLIAIANDGYIFDHWDDWACANPRYTPATSASFNRVAYFRPLSKDTLHYCSDDFCDYVYWGLDSAHLGFRYPTSALAPGRAITAVQYFACDTGQYTLLIYQDDSTTLVPVYSETYYITDTNKWQDLILATPYNIDNTRPLWVTLKTYGLTKVATFSSIHSGNYYGPLVRCLDDSEWCTYCCYKHTWMIKAITTEAEPTPVDNLQTDDVTLAPNPIHAGETAYIYGDWTDAELDGMLLEVLTVDGRTITRTTPQSSPITVRGITAPGTYIIKITTGTGSLHTCKLTVN